MSTSTEMSRLYDELDAAQIEKNAADEAAAASATRLERAHAAIIRQERQEDADRMASLSTVQEQSYRRASNPNGLHVG